jgi:hypothetical protein
MKALTRMRLRFFPTALVSALSAGASAQTPGIPVAQPQYVTVNSSVEPMPLNEPARSFRTFDLTQPGILELYNSPEDLLRLDPSINLQERAPGGAPPLSKR